MVDCRYSSFYALAKINDPELLYEAFQQQIAPGHADKIEIEVFEHSDDQWKQLTRSGGHDNKIDEAVLSVLEKQFDFDDEGAWYYNADVGGWFCSYKPLTTKNFVLLIKSSDPDKLIEEDYLQFLFHFYCHQLQMLQGTYRDALTGLYNRRAFNEKLGQLLDRNVNHQRRAINFTPSIYVMLDIDHFKQINDSRGHLFGDEVLLLLAQHMTDSFRDNDLLFRYGGEEFAMVLMDIEPDQARQTLNRFREKIANQPFADLNQVTVSIGYTAFDKRLSLDELIGQADTALYYCKTTSRNAVHSYQDLSGKGLIPKPKTPKPRHIEVS